MKAAYYQKGKRLSLWNSTLRIALVKRCATSLEEPAVEAVVTVEEASLIFRREDEGSADEPCGR